MKTFEGWRAVGRAMRWARQQGEFHPCAGRVWHDYRMHGWTHPTTDRKVVVSHHAAFGASLVAVNGSTRRDLDAAEAAESLRVLAALDLIPAELAEVADA